MAINPMKWIATLFCVLIGCAYGFRFKRPPQLPSQPWTNVNIFVGQRSISKDTRCYAFENDGRGRGRGRDALGGRGTSNGRGGTKDSGAYFLFDQNNYNPTQGEVDAYFRNNPNPSPQEVVDILLRTVTWKKKRMIDVLSGDKLLIVMSALQRMLSVFDRRQLRFATIGLLECLLVIPLVDIEKSGSWHSFIYSLLSNSHAAPDIMILLVQRKQCKSQAC